jgi:hypothetical protein
LPIQSYERRYPAKALKFQGEAIEVPPGQVLQWSDIADAHETWVEIFDFVGPSGFIRTTEDDVDPQLWLPMVGRTKVCPGYWVVQLEDGQFSVMSPTEFHEAFRRCARS